MVIAALLVIPVLVIEETDPGQPLEAIGQILNWGTWLAFVVEAVIMIRVTPRPWEWIKRHPIDVAVIFLSPPFIPGGLAAARLFRLLRVLRLTRIFSMSRLLSLEGICYAAFIAAFVVLIGGAAYSAVETDQNLSAWDGIWWAVTTVTTVGYGDSYPTTDIGRVIAMCVMAVGIGFVALITAYVADRFIRKEVGDATLAREEDILVELRRVSERLERLEEKLDTGGSRAPAEG
jgi:voltage-gated potassium channel